MSEEETKDEKREAIQSQIDKFLGDGGKIEKVPNGFSGQDEEMHLRLYLSKQKVRCFRAKQKDKDDD